MTLLNWHCCTPLKPGASLKGLLTVDFLHQAAARFDEWLPRCALWGVSARLPTDSALPMQEMSGSFSLHTWWMVQRSSNHHMLHGIQQAWNLWVVFLYFVVTALYVFAVWSSQPEMLLHRLI
jgi:hypothetical protein